MKHVLPLLVLFLAGCPDPSLRTAYEPFPWRGLVLLVAVILAWYLGVWYGPTVLAQVPAPFPVNPLKVVSPVAYTQGWVWRVAQAHAMGYSEQRFGYWSDEPLSLDDFIKVPVKP